MHSSTLVQARLNAERHQRCRRSAPACARIRVRAVILHPTGRFVPQDCPRSGLPGTLNPTWSWLSLERNHLEWGQQDRLHNRARERTSPPQSLVNHHCLVEELKGKRPWECLLASTSPLTHCCCLRSPQTRLKSQNIAACPAHSHQYLTGSTLISPTSFPPPRLLHSIHGSLRALNHSSEPFGKRARPAVCRSSASTSALLPTVRKRFDHSVLPDFQVSSYHQQQFYPWDDCPRCLSSLTVQAASTST